MADCIGNTVINTTQKKDAGNIVGNIDELQKAHPHWQAPLSSLGARGAISSAAAQRLSERQGRRGPRAQRLYRTIVVMPEPNLAPGILTETASSITGVGECQNPRAFQTSSKATLNKFWLPFWRGFVTSVWSSEALTRIR